MRERLVACVPFVRDIVAEHAMKALSYAERKAIVKGELRMLCEKSEMSPHAAEVALTKWFNDVLVRVAMQELMDEGSLYLDSKLLLRVA